MPHRPLPLASAALAALALLLSACSGSPSAEQVAGAFWSALRDGRVDEARAVALPIDAGRLAGLEERYPITAVELGAAEETGEDTASVETTLPLPQGSASFAFPTHMTRVHGEWRVDAQKTLTSMQQALLTRSLEQADAALRESGRAFGEALGRSAQQASEAIEEALREFGRALEEGLPATPPGSTPPGPAPAPREPSPPAPSPSQPPGRDL